MKRKWWKALLVSTLVLCMFVATAVSTEVEAGSQTTGNAIKLNSGAVVQGYSDISSYRTEGAFTAPSAPGDYANYIFAGWYTDDTCGTALASNVTSTGLDANATYYAKFVPKEILGLRAQVLANTTYKSDKTDIRFVTTVDSLRYDTVGFDLEFKGNSYNGKSNTVYKNLYVMNKEGTVQSNYEPSVVFHEMSQYFMACNFRNVGHADFGDAFIVTPYWITLDGTKVPGNAEIYTINTAYTPSTVSVATGSGPVYNIEPNGEATTDLEDISTSCYAQGGCTDGTYYYQAFVYQADSSKEQDSDLAYIVKYDMASGKVVDISENLDLHHANDFTYNSDLDVLVICHNAPYKNRVTFVKRESLEIASPSELGITKGGYVLNVEEKYIELGEEVTTTDYILGFIPITKTETVELELFSIEYNKTLKQYVVGIAGGNQTFRILDTNFGDVYGKAFNPIDNDIKAFTTQGITADDNYIYFVLFNSGGSITYGGHNGHVIAVYDWNGNAIRVINIATTNGIPVNVEPENISVYDNKFYIGCKGSGVTASIYQIDASSWTVKAAENEAYIGDGDSKVYYTTLENAVSAAQSGDTITIVADTVDVSSLMSIAVENVTITNEAGVNVTVKRGADYNGYLIQNSASLVVKSNETGSLSFDSGAYRGKTYIYNTGTLTLKNIAMKNILANTAGGAVYTTGSVSITGCKFNDIDNTANGGAVCVNGGVATVEGSTFADNATTKQAGAIWIGNDATVSSLTESTFTNNSSGTSGGAIYNTGKLHMETTTFDSNDAGSVGGAINCASGVMTVDACIFDSNTAVSDGGAVQVADSSDATFTEEKGEGTFKRNVAGTWKTETDEETSEPIETVDREGRGGAIHTNNSILSVAGYTFDGNSATSTGGAVNIGDGSAKTDTITFKKAEFVNNKAEGNGGAINNAGRVVEVAGCKFGDIKTGNTTDEDGNVVTETVSLGNTADGQGGAIYHAENKLTVTGSAFSSNNSSGGGAIRIANAAIEAAIEKSEFYLNSSTGHGGAIYNSAQAYSEDAEYYLTITDCSFGSSETITDEETGKTTINVSNGNTATGNGGAIYNGDSSIINLVGNANATVAPVFADNKAEGNLAKASDNLGGGAILVGTGEVYVDGYTFNKNSATKNQGGAIRAGGSTNCTIKNSQFNSNESGASGGAIYKNGEMTVENSDFTGNKAGSVAGAINSDAKNATIRNCNFSSNESGAKNANNAGAIQVNGGEVTIEVTDAKNYTFNENKATGKAGGAIFVTGADASLNIKKAEGATGTITFVDNEAATGGAICVNRGTVVVTGIAFEGNGATNGGAIYVDGTSNTDKTEHYAGTLTASDCTFEGNTATTSGGAVYLSNAQGGTSAVINENSTFTKNVASSDYGGAIYSESTIATDNAYGLIVEDSIFGQINTEAGEDEVAKYLYANTATTNGRYGGAIYVKTGNAKIADAEFLYNHSCNGGAIGASGANDLTIDNVEFVGNKATHAGSGGQGGALRLVGATKGTIKDCVFEQNIANRQGGALALENDNTEVKVYNSKFDGNKGTNGGAIRVVNKATLYLNDNETADKGNSIFTNNQATEGQGGAIICEAPNITCEIYNYNFTNNQATTNGGAISTVASTITGGTFVGNSAVNGGAIFNTGTLNMTAITFRENNASSVAGAIGCEGGVMTAEDCSFISNTSVSNGGAVQVENQSNATFVSENGTGLFQGNTAGTWVLDENGAPTDAVDKKANGGAIQINSSLLSVTGYTFDNNSATSTGGAVFVGKDEFVGEVTEDEKIIKFTGTKFVNNKAKDAGGAIGNGVADGDKGRDMQIDSCTFGDSATTGNSAGGLGGAIHQRANELSITNTSFIGNKSSSNGGAIYGAYSAKITLSGTKSDKEVFQTNTAEGAYGGGAIDIGSGTLEVIGYTFKDNHATSTATTAGGGAIGLHPSNIVATITNSVFESNEAVGNGGAISNQSTKTGADVLTITNCTFGGENVGNKSTGGNGGAIYSAKGSVRITGTDGAAIFKANTVTTNSKVGGAIYISAGSLTINSYTFDTNIAKHQGGAIYVAEGTTTNITDTNFNGNKTNDASGGAIWNQGALTVTRVNFNGNSSGTGGAAINCEGGNAAKELIVDSCNFTSNTAKGKGGAITMVSGSVVELIGTGTFQGNTAGTVDAEGNITSVQTGGAIHANTAKLSITGYTFDGNTATGDGGAICFQNDANFNETITIANSSFVNNETSANGGAICANRNVTITDSDFGGTDAGNSAVGNGGAIYVTNGKTVTLTKSETATEMPAFTGNSVTGETSVGGAIFVDNGTVDVTEYSFVGNSAVSGGAICVSGTTVTTTVKDEATGEETPSSTHYAGNLKASGCIFDGNTASYVAVKEVFDGGGGAICLDASAAGTMATISNSEFIRNSTANTSGGAIYSASVITEKDEYGLNVDNCTFGKDNDLTYANSTTTATGINAYGGAIYVTKGNAKIVDTSFLYNKSRNGGAIGAKSAGIIHITTSDNVDNALFKGNNVTNQGGAIRFWGADSKSSVSGYTFESNSSGGNGGAIELEANSSLAISNCEFTSNVSSKNGGAILTYTAITISDSSSFTDNRASEQGGAIYSSATLTIGSEEDSADKTIFTKNKGTYGGGIRSSSTLNIYNADFTENEATSYQGGAIYSTKALTAVSVNFTDNKAKTDGGAIHSEGGTKNIYYCKFESNTAGRYGGAMASVGSSTTTITGIAGSETAIFKDNTAAQLGGALYNGASGTLKVYNYTFTGNKAAPDTDGNATDANGNAIYFKKNAADLTIGGCTFNASPNQTIIYTSGTGFTTPEEYTNTINY